MKNLLESDVQAGIDLHIHSTASDGSLSPSEIRRTAIQIGLKAISITDHDTLAGVVALRSEHIPPELEFVPGIEISASPPPGYPINGSVHILGYGIDPEDPTLNRLLVDLKQAREDRNPKIIAKLKELGMELSIADLADIVGDAIAGRPHIAQLMVKKNFVESVNDAFDRFLGKNKPAYVHKYRIPMDVAISTIQNAGGIAVLAHPYLNGITDTAEFESFLLTLKAMGLRGIEAIYPAHSSAATSEYCRLARKYNLLVTGGTDFHGAASPGIRMGVGRGRLHVPYVLYQNLMTQLNTSNE